MKQDVKIKSIMPVSYKSLKPDSNQLLYRDKFSVNNIKQSGQDSVQKQIKSHSYSLPSESFQATLSKLMQRNKRKQFLPSQPKEQKDKQQRKFSFNTPKNYKRYSHVKDHHKYNILAIKSKIQSQKPIFIQNQSTLAYFNNHVNNVRSQNLKQNSEKIIYRDSLLYQSPQSVKSNKSYHVSQIKHQIEKFLRQEDDISKNKNARSFSKDIFDLPKNRHKKGIRSYLNKKHSKGVNMGKQVVHSNQASFEQIYKQQIERKLSRKKEQNQTSCEWKINKKSFSIKQMKLKRKGCNPYSVVAKDIQLNKNLQQNTYQKVMYFKSKKLDDDSLDQKEEFSITNSNKYIRQDQLDCQNKTGDIVYKNKGSTFYLNYPQAADDCLNFKNQSWIQKRGSMGDTGFNNQAADVNYIQPWQKQVQDQDHLLATHNDKHIFSATKIRSFQAKKNKKRHF